MSRHLLADGGQSGCRLAHVVEGERVETTRSSGLSRAKRDASEAAPVRAIEQAMRNMYSPPEAVDALVFGLTGFDNSPEAATAIARGVRSLVRAERVVVTNDAVTSYLGAIGAEPGAVVAAGTGIIVLAGDEYGGFVRGDGWGYILGDDGGGYYIGRRGLAAALRSHEGRGGSEALRRRAAGIFGSPEDMKRHIYGSDNPVGEVAKFAPEVAEAAREGDPAAKEIWSDAASEAALTVTASLERLFGPERSVSVSWTGGLFAGVRDLMLEPFKKNVADARPSATLIEPKGGALLGAELLANSKEISMFASLIHVFE